MVSDSANPTGVSDAELAACVATLQKLHGEEAHQIFQSSPRFKPLRTALVPLITDLRAKFFHGNSAASDNSRQERKRAKKVERARQKALDQQYVNNTKLRAERLARLAALQKQNPLLANVPDGVAAAGEPMLLKENGEEEKTKAAEKEKDEKENETEQLHYHRGCYTCKVKFRKLHHFYDRMCPSCAELNYKKRLQNADLRGHIAVVTGARVKIGYEITLKLLRSGAMVVATTRFPKDAAFRYAKEKDFEAWKDRLQIYGMDFRDLGVIDKFMDHIEETFGSLDILVNNATQTIRRPVHYFKHLIECEVAPVPDDMAQVNQILRGNANLLGSAPAAANVEVTMCLSTVLPSLARMESLRRPSPPVRRPRQHRCTSRRCPSLPRTSIPRKRQPCSPRARWITTSSKWICALRIRGSRRSTRSRQWVRSWACRCPVY